MEDVQFLQRHQVEQAEDRIPAMEVTPFIKHEATPGETWPVGDSETGDLPIHPGDWETLFDLDGQQLAQRLNTVKDTRGLRRSHYHGVG